MKITLEIDNISMAQACAIEDLFALWQELGAAGSSRWTAFYADGDGSFQPKVTIDGKKPQRCMLNIGPRWGKVKLDPASDHLDVVFLLDYDRISLAMRSASNGTTVKSDDQKAN